MSRDWRAEAAAIPNLIARAQYLKRVHDAAPAAERGALWWALSDVVLEGAKRLAERERERVVVGVGEDYDPWAAGF